LTRIAKVLLKFASQIRLPSLPRQVRKRYDPNQALGPVENRQTTNLLLSHILGDTAQILVLEHIPDLRRHHLPHLGAFWITAVGDKAQSNVAIGHNAYQAVTFAHRQHARVLVTHQPRDLLDGVIGIGKSRVPVHHVADAAIPSIVPLTFCTTLAAVFELLLQWAQCAVSGSYGPSESGWRYPQ
jgi:hypothetical protein